MNAALVKSFNMLLRLSELVKQQLSHLVLPEMLYPFASKLRLVELSAAGAHCDVKPLSGLIDSARVRSFCKGTHFDILRLMVSASHRKCVREDAWV